MTGSRAHWEVESDPKMLFHSSTLGLSDFSLSEQRIVPCPPEEVTPVAIAPARE